MLSIRNLEVAYNDVVHVLHGVSLEVPEGAIVCLLGVNGAGKTTIARAVSGLLPIHNGEVRSGEIRFQNVNLRGLSPRRRMALGLAQVMEGRRIFTSLSVQGNLIAGTYGRTSRTDVGDRLEQAYQRFPKLRERAHQRAGYLSGGEQQMLAIGRALMGQPRLLILDEPSLGLAPALVEEVSSIILELHADGTSILLIEQAAQMALSLASHGYVVETGRVVHDAPAHELLEDRDIQEFYLGMGDGTVTSIADTKRYRRRKRWLS